MFLKATEKKSAPGRTAVQAHHRQVPRPHLAHSTQETYLSPRPPELSSVPSTFASHSTPIPWRVKACLPFTSGESAEGWGGSREHPGRPEDTLVGPQAGQPTARLLCPPVLGVGAGVGWGEGGSKTCRSSQDLQTTPTSTPTPAQNPPCTAPHNLQLKRTVQSAASPAGPNRPAPPAALRESDPRSVWWSSKSTETLEIPRTQHFP